MAVSQRGLIQRVLSALRLKQSPAIYQTVPSRRSWFSYLVREPFAGAWQRNMEGSTEDVLSFAPVYACITLIASDIGKLRIKLVEQDADGIWTETESPAFSPVLREPNHYQTRIEFIEHWVAAKYIHGNAYILKKRDERGLVTDLYVLDSSLVKVMVSPSGEVFYGLSADHLAGETKDVVVPAREIIHDKCPTLYHPLVGVSPLTACALAAMQGLRVQRNSEAFFGNGSMPSGIVELPDEIDDEQARDYERRWLENFGGPQNAGRVAALGAGTKFTPLTMRAVDAQLIEQLKWTGENVCTAFKVPPYMVGIGPMPTYNNIEALSAQYYAQCLQNPIEKIELHLDRGLGLDQGRIGGKRLGTEMDLDDLLRMDSANRIAAAEKAMKSGMSPNEVRRIFHGLGKVEGGEQPYLQEQNWPLNILSEREVPVDAPAPPSGPSEPNVEEKPNAEPVDKSVLLKAFQSGLKEAA
jgi:HK97 family phage portal protein